MKKLSLLLVSILLYSAQTARADNGDISISLDNNDLPASDLQYQGRTLTPQEAWELKTKSHVDLSTLEPASRIESPTLIVYQGSSTEADSAPGGLDASLPIENNDEVLYNGTVGSSPGEFRFSVTINPLRMPTRTSTTILPTLNILAARNLHTLLLRKEILRKLGYELPATKYLSKIKLRFSNIFTRDSFLTLQLPAGVEGSADHWCRMSPNVLAKDIVDNKKQTIPCRALTADDGISLTDDPNVIVLQDVAATDAVIHRWPLAVGGPPIQVIPNTDPAQLRPEGPRLLRALAIPFSLVDMNESLNQTDWYAAHIQNNSVTINPNDVANYACTVDDAAWILKKIANYTREDFMAMVKRAYFPETIAQVVVEKLVARRNSLFTAFKLPAPQMTPDDKITLGSAVRDGKVMQQDWQGYASRYAYGDPESPLKGLGWYALSQVQSNVMETLINKANKEIPALTFQQGAQKHQVALMTKAYEDYLKTGELQTVKFGVWAAPIANGGVNISREVVFGNYLGTNNLVQLADSFGINATVGLIVAVDALPAFLGVNGLVTANLNFNVTHLKPIFGFKAGVTEPLDREFVPWLFFHTADIFEKVAATKNAPPSTTADQLKQQLVDNLNKVSTFLGIGESFILTETLTGTEEVSVAVQAPIPVSPSASVRADGNQILLSRLQIYRKDATTITIFRDNGELNGFSLSFAINVGAPINFPILTFTAKSVAGAARSKSFSVDITADPSRNPQIYASANALTHALKTGSTDILESIQKPTVVSVKFKDKSNAFHFFHYQHRRLKTNAKIEVVQPDGTTGNYLVLNDGKQSGHHYQALATEVATYVVQRLTNDGSYGVDTQAAVNPGQSLLGDSRTRNVEFQSRFDHGVSEPYVRITSRFEGWNIKAAGVQKIADDWSNQYGFQLYPTGFLRDTVEFKLYNMNINLHFYTAAIQALTSMTPDQEKVFEARYELINGCDSSSFDQNNTDDLVAPPKDASHCESINDFQHAFKVYRRNLLKPEKQAEAVMDMFSALDQFANFPELVALLGGPTNVYVTSQVNGFRIGSESSSPIPVPIPSNTYGSADPVNPSGVVDAVENDILGVGDGEFYMQWLRDVL